MSLVLYIAAIGAANVITAGTAPLELGPFLIPWGTFAVAATFVLRDYIQREHGRTVAYIAVAVGLITAGITSAILGDTLAVVVASALALGLSEALDTEVFTRWPGKLPERVLVSGLFGSALDTTLFVIVGLSPLWSGIVPWAAVPNAVLGVFVVKAAVQTLGAALAWIAYGNDEPVEVAA
jgi:queuosine precursor transporter